MVLANVPQDSVEKYYGTQNINYYKVKIVPYTSNAVAQCFNYQGYGHSSLCCSLEPKCVKCAQSHAFKTCTKPRDTNAKCANCDGNHTANYRGGL